MKYLKYFEQASAYEAYKVGDDFILPNVSYVEENNEVKFSGNDFIIMTSESNPEVMKICYNQGWAASPYEMYASEAASITSIGTAFRDLGQGYSNDYGYSGYDSGYDSGYGSSSSSFTFSFDEFKYFTGVTTIEYNAFSNSKIVSITIPNSVTSIGESAFYYCTSLVSIDIPDSVTSIGPSAFYWCSGLTSITIGSGVIEIDMQAFYWCQGLTSIVVVPGNTKYDSRENCNCLIETATNRLIQGCGNSFIPNGVTSIGDSAFDGCSGLTGELVIPDGVTSIGDSAFHSCNGLTSIVIPDSVIYIGGYAFTYCSGLTEVHIGSGVTEIGEKTFDNCSSLTSINIPDSVKTIGQRAFSSCSGLNEITCNAMTAPTIYNRTFYGVMKYGILKVPAGSDYSSWMSTSSYYLGYYNWTVQEI